MKNDLLPVPRIRTKAMKRRMLSWKWRVTALFTACLQALAMTLCWLGNSTLKAQEPPPSQSQSAADRPPGRPARIKVNRGIPQANPLPLPLSFTFPVTDEQITKANALEEVLAPIGGKTSKAENKALAEALIAYTRNRADRSALEHFVESHPKSPWRASILTNLGIIYRSTGYYSKAQDAWKKAWELARTETQYPRTVVADRAVAELAHLLSNVGRTEELQLLLESIQDRKMYGAPATDIMNARSALVVMLKKPGISFKCGAYALDSIQNFLQPDEPAKPLVADAKSGVQGLSLAQVHDLSRQMGMNFQAARRTAGAPLILPAVVHWKVGHYAAILKKVNDVYLVKDPTFGQDTLLTQEAIDAEASGYYLVPQGELPGGWGAVAAGEENTVWGRGFPGGRDGKKTKDCDKSSGCSGSGGMPVASILLLLACLHIEDTPVSYEPPAGPVVSFKVAYNQYEASQTGSFATSNLGNNWVQPWLSYIKRPGAVGGTVTVVVQGGGSEEYPSSTFTSAGSNTGTYGAQVQFQTVLFVNGNYYERRFPDGSKEIFASPIDSHGYVYLTGYQDPQGRSLTFQYETVADGYRLKYVFDALNQKTTLNYDLSADDLKITGITDPFGRQVKFGYTLAGGKYQLTSITDVIGITSQFTYQPGTDAIVAMTTPYGTTTFTASQTADGDSDLVITDPNGGKQRALARFAEYVNTPVEAFPNVSFAVNGGSGDLNLLEGLNTYYWDKKAMMDAPGDLTKAHIYHWLFDSALNQASGVLYCEKAPLESRVWYNYPRSAANAAYPYLLGTSDKPTGVARLLDDGSTQYFQFQYNGLGMPTQRIDPLNRQANYSYDPSNNIDLTKVQGPNGDVLTLLGYDPSYPAHLAKTITDAAGQTRTLTYNALGQIWKILNAKGELTTFNYNTSTHYPESIVSPTGATMSLAYDDYGRMESITDSDGYTVTYAYDALNRPTVLSYPDGTYEQIIYNLLDVGWKRDRLGRWTTFYYDATRNLVAAQDPLGRLTRYGYCSCGSLISLIDPAGSATAWIHDVQRRPIVKIYADGTKTQYSYDFAGRLASTIDQKGQVKKYTYFKDNNLKSVDYLHTEIPMASVSFSYDASYNRITSRQDGTGTTSYAYIPYSAAIPPAINNGSGRLLSETGPLAVLTYSYDELGRCINRSITDANPIQAITDSNSDTVTYDSLGRVASETNPLGSFFIDYDAASLRVNDVRINNATGPIIAKYLYYGNVNAAGTGNGDRRLQQIQNLTPSGANAGAAVLSQFDYTYDAEGNIRTWTRQNDGNTATVSTYNFENDVVNQLTGATLRNSGSPAVVHNYFYGYDLASNRTSVQFDNQVTKETPNSVNQLQSKQGGGPLRFSGTLNEPATVTVAGKPATVTTTAAGTNFTGYANVVAGSNNVTVSATDASGQTSTHIYQVNVTAGAAQSFTYDLNGNMTGDGTRTFGWDAENRLVSITQPGSLEEFVYNGVGQRVAQRLNGAVKRQWVWEGMSLREERDAEGNVTKHYYSQGQRQVSVNAQPAILNYYYTRDHLGSIREMADGSGVNHARYDYDPYGRYYNPNGGSNTNLVTTNPVDADFGYTGHFWDSSASLYLTANRAYDPQLGRWLSRDPLGESAGVNLYGYVFNAPSNGIDPLGLCAIFEFNDGSKSRTVKTALDFETVVQKAGAGTIKSITITGAHCLPNSSGRYDTQELDGSNKKNLDNITIGGDGRPKLRSLGLGSTPDPELSNGKGADLGNLLAGKMAKNGTFTYRGCHSGDSSGTNIAQATSSALPNIPVDGANGAVQGIPDTNAVISYSGYSTYLNGQNITPVPQAIKYNYFFY